MYELTTASHTSQPATLQPLYIFLHISAASDLHEYRQYVVFQNVRPRQRKQALGNHKSHCAELSVSTNGVSQLAASGVLSPTSSGLSACQTTRRHPTSRGNGVSRHIKSRIRKMPTEFHALTP